VTADLVRAVVRDERRVLTVSRRHDRLGGVVLSLPAVVGRHGADTVLDPVLDAAETAALAHSAQVLQAALDSLAPAA
jgi:L-lactate dehydrogenase